MTEHGLEVLGRTHLRLRFGTLDLVYPVFLVDSIAHKFIIGNDLLLLYKCDIFIVVAKLATALSRRGLETGISKSGRVTALIH